MRAIVMMVLGIALATPPLATAQARADARYFESDGVQIRYVDAGTGDPVLLIHGFGGRLEFWEATGIVAGLTAAGFRIIAYDSRGHGQSGKPHDPEQYGEEEVADAIRLLDHLSLERAHLVAYSRGSEIASHVVARHPKRVRSVVYGGWGVGNPVATLSRADCRATADALHRGAFPLPLAQALRPVGAPPLTAEQQAAGMRQLAAGNDMEALAAAFGWGCEAHRITAAALRATGVPALAIVGASDGMAPSVLAMGREMGGVLQVSVIPEADHNTTPGHPDFLARLVQFLRGRP